MSPENSALGLHRSHLFPATCCGATATRAAAASYSGSLRRGFLNAFHHLNHCFLHLLIKSMSPSFSLPPPAPPPILSFYLSLLLSISLTRSLACVTPLPPLIDDEKNLPRTGALLKTGQYVLSVGTSGDGWGGQLRGLQRQDHTDIQLLHFGFSFPVFISLHKLSLPALPRFVYLIFFYGFFLISYPATLQLHYKVLFFFFFFWNSTEKSLFTRGTAGWG